MRYNGPNPNKQAGGVPDWPLVAQPTRHKREIPIIVSADMWWEHGGKHLPEFGAEECPFNRAVVSHVITRRMALALNSHFHLYNWSNQK